MIKFECRIQNEQKSSYTDKTVYMVTAQDSVKAQENINLSIRKYEIYENNLSWQFFAHVPMFLESTSSPGCLTNLQASSPE